MAQPTAPSLIVSICKIFNRPSIAMRAALLMVMSVWLVASTGCGVSGYAGGGITGLSASSITIDSGQSIAITSTVTGAPIETWSLTGSTCSGAACGSLSSTSGVSVIYTSPSGLTAQIVVTATAAVTGTQNIKTVAITVNPDPVIAGIMPAGNVGAPYSATFTVAGGTAPLKTWSVASGTLPPGLALNATTGAVSGVPTAAGSSTFAVQITDSSAVPFTATATRTIVISAAIPALTVIAGNPPSGNVGIAYATTLTASGGVTPYTWSILTGSVPAGLSLSASTGVISGIPTTQGTSTFTAQAQDAVGTKASGVFSITINAAPVLTLTTAALPNGVVGTPYSATIGVTGGTAPYACSVTAGTLPAGLSLSGCVVSGIPTVVGTQTVAVRATDSSTPTRVGTGPETITITKAPLVLTLTSLPSGTVNVPYSATIGVSGGTGPYNCTITSGNLQAGLVLTGCVVSGIPTVASTVILNVVATDSSNPTQQTTGPVSLTINPAGSLTIGPLPPGTVGAPYNAPIVVTGGNPPYTCAITLGTLPPGLTLNGCLITGTPTTPGTTTVTIKATDSGNPTKTTSSPVVLVINPAPLVLTTTNLPAGTVGTPYTGTIGVSGGTAPYNCTITAGTLQAGLSISGCVVSGTPTVASTVILTVMATDAGTPTQSTTGPVSLTINPAPVTLTLSSPPNGTMNTPYSGTIGVSGGTAPYLCTINSGTLQAGLSLNGCVISGTPTTSGTANLSVTATDSSHPAVTKTGPVTLTIVPAGATLTITSPPNATINTPYTGAIGVTGGQGPYTCVITAGTLQAGLTLSGCVISGTPTVAGSVNLTVKATDSTVPSNSTTGPVTMTVLPVPLLTLTGSVPNAILGVPYTQTLQAAGGIKPYTYTQTAGTLPAGLTLSSAGVISGTPTAVGASSFTATVTDTEPVPQTASLPLVLLVTYPVTTTDADLTGPYAFLFQGYDDVTLGLFAYQTASVGSFTADGAGVISAGEQDANHQSSNPTGATITSKAFLGTYTIGTDLRGLMTITTLNADGTVSATSTYAISLKTPVAPSTISTQASLIEFDNNQLQGTKGSGTLLAQTPTSFPSALAGSYAFGLQGDTPCLPTCTIGIVAGPVASVGQFTTNNTGLITTGTSDLNIGANNLSIAQLGGSYGTADGNGRLSLTMSTAGTLNGVYPSDYAVYVVNANQSFVLSTDKHSAYIMLAGSMQKQTLNSFSNASMTGPFVGYENSPTNPGLVGTTLDHTLNLSTATIFRGTADAAGGCTTTNVDTAGLTAVVNGLTGLGSGAPILNALLGTYASTGPSTCTTTGSGRGVLNYPTPNAVLTQTLSLLGLPTTPPPARTFYLYAPNQGFFLETGYAGLGRFEPQTGAPFSLATLNGRYVYASDPASSAASIDSSGVFTSNGAGQATTTQDLNIGVGTLNVLQLGVTSTSQYLLTDPTAGRYLLGATVVIYAINPSRFVLLDEDPTKTSPSYSLLY